MDKNKLVFDEIKRYVDLVNYSHGDIRNNYKNMVKDLMLAIASKDWSLYDECQKYIFDNYISEVD